MAPDKDRKSTTIAVPKLGVGVLVFAMTAPVRRSEGRRVLRSRRRDGPNLVHKGSIGRNHLGGCRGCDPVLDRLANLFEGAGLDLAHAFARYAEFVCQLIELARLFSEAAGDEDPPLTLVEQLERLRQGLTAVGGLLAFNQNLLLWRRIVDQPILQRG